MDCLNCKFREKIMEDTRITFETAKLAKNFDIYS